MFKLIRVMCNRGGKASQEEVVDGRVLCNKGDITSRVGLRRSRGGLAPHCLVRTHGPLGTTRREGCTQTVFVRKPCPSPHHWYSSLDSLLTQGHSSHEILLLTVFRDRFLKLLFPLGLTQPTSVSINRLAGNISLIPPYYRKPYVILCVH